LARAVGAVQMTTAPVVGMDAGGEKAERGMRKEMAARVWLQILP